MKKLLVTAVLALTCVSVTVPRASAQSAQFQFSPISITAAPGENIVFGINLVYTSAAGGRDLSGLSYWLQQNGSSPFIFTITRRDRTDSPFTDPITSDSFFTNFGDPMNSTSTGTGLSNTRDLGALVAEGPQGDPNMFDLGSGTYFVANITLTINGAAAPGTYTIQSTTAGGKTSVVNNPNGTTFPIQPDTLTVTVVPEPSTYALLAVGAIAAGVGAYRRRRTA